MSISFFITPYPPMDWKIASSSLMIDPNAFDQQLKSFWPDINTNMLGEGGLSWSLKEDNLHEFYGRLQNNLQLVSFAPGAWNAMYEFVLWYRKLVPLDYELYFFASNTWDSLRLIQDTTQEDIKNYIRTKT